MRRLSSRTRPRQRLIRPRRGRPEVGGRWPAHRRGCTAAPLRRSGRRRIPRTTPASAALATGGSRSWAASAKRCQGPAQRRRMEPRMVRAPARAEMAAGVRSTIGRGTGASTAMWRVRPASRLAALPCRGPARGVVFLRRSRTATEGDCAHPCPSLSGIGSTAWMVRDWKRRGSSRDQPWTLCQCPKGAGSIRDLRPEQIRFGPVVIASGSHAARGRPRRPGPGVRGAIRSRSARVGSGGRRIVLREGPAIRSRLRGAPGRSLSVAAGCLVSAARPGQSPASHPPTRLPGPGPARPACAAASRPIPAGRSPACVGCGRRCRPCSGPCAASGERLPASPGLGRRPRLSSRSGGRRPGGPIRHPVSGLRLLSRARLRLLR